VVHRRCRKKKWVSLCQEKPWPFEKNEKEGESKKE